MVGPRWRARTCTLVLCLASSCLACGGTAQSSGTDQGTGSTSSSGATSGSGGGSASGGARSSGGSGGSGLCQLGYAGDEYPIDQCEDGRCGYRMCGTREEMWQQAGLGEGGAPAECPPPELLTRTGSTNDCENRHVRCNVGTSAVGRCCYAFLSCFR